MTRSGTRLGLLALLAIGIAISTIWWTRSASIRASLAATMKRLDSLAANFEDLRDVKCWTSFKQLETFVAGCQLSPQTTHLKTSVVLNYLDQIWAAAGRNALDAEIISRDVFEAASMASFPYEEFIFERYSVQLAEREITVPFQDVQNYLGTVEPIRLLQTAAHECAARDPLRPGLTDEAIEAAVPFAALLSTLVLKEANLFARRSQHLEIEAADVEAADQSIAAAAGLLPLTAEHRSRRARNSSAQGETPHASMLEIIRAKIRSLGTFNAAYTRDALDTVFDADLAHHEEEWAGLPVDSAAARDAKESRLVELGRFLYTEAARQHPSSDPVSGSEMLDTIVGHYPFVTLYQGTTILFPNDGQIRNMSVEEYQADAFRDSAWHWRALERVMTTATRDALDLPTLDLYALEELSEFLSVYGVAMFRGAGALARHAGEARVTEGSFDELQVHVAGARQRHREREPAPASTGNFPGASIARRQLQESYIDEVFSDVTKGSGIDFEHQTSDLVSRYRFAPGRIVRENDDAVAVPELEIGIAGGGVAVGDVDGDGRLDIYLVSGARDRLFRNLGGLRFEDITDASGLFDDGEGRGAYFVDFDNDGDQDLFITQVYAPNRLFRNDGTGKFEDATDEVGLPRETYRVSHSAVWFDFDRDGRLDVYVGNFGDWLGDRVPHVSSNSRNAQPDRLYRQTAEERFEDISERAGVGNLGWSHALSHFDANGDGWQDLYVANDFGADVLLLNDGGKRFVDATPPILENRFLHGMSVGFSDVNRDGIEDVYVSNIAMFTFVSKYVQPRAGTSLRLSQRTAANTRMVENNMLLISGNETFAEDHHGWFERSVDGCGWAWDADFFDFDNDGLEDLYVLNGREPNLSYDRERNVLFKRNGDRFFDVSAGSGADFAGNSRGAAYADFDGDGDLDVICNNYQSPAVLLRNNLQRNHWIRFQLEGTLSNRDAVGARVTLRVGGRVTMRTVRGGSGFLSKEPPGLHFGLGRSVAPVEVEILWPNGQTQRLASLETDREHRITEPR